VRTIVDRRGGTRARAVPAGGFVLISGVLIPDGVCDTKWPYKEDINMDRRFIGVLIGAVVTAAATMGAQAPSQQSPARHTVTGCLQKGDSGGFVLTAAGDEKSAAAGQTANASGAVTGSSIKQTYALIGVVPPGLKLGELVNKKIEVVGLMGDSASKDAQRQTLTMQSVKPLTGSCS
jgi:gas vesicle protein